MLRFNVTGMSCGHCTAAIEQAIKALDPQAEVATDIKLAQVSVQSTATAAQLSEAIVNAGYENSVIAG